MTEWPRWTRIVLRLALAAFCWMTAAYAFLVSSAFAYLQFVRPRVFPWVGRFSDLHPWLLVLWTMAAFLALWPDLRNPRRARGPAVAFLVVAVLACAWNFFRPILAGLTDGNRSVTVGVLVLLPLVWLAALDYLQAAAYLARQRPPQNEVEFVAFEGRLFRSSLAAAVVVTVLYAVITSIAVAGAFEPDLLLPGLAEGLAASFLGHLGVFSAAFLLVASLVRITRHFAAQSAALALAFTAALSIAFGSLVGGALSLQGAAGSIAAIATALSIVGTWTGLRLRTLQSEGVELDSAVDLYFGHPGTSPAGGGSTGNRFATRLALVAALAYGLVLLSNSADWDFVLLESGVLIVWACVFGSTYRLTASSRHPVNSVTIVATCLLPLVAGVAFDAPAVRAYSGPRGPAFVDRYVVYNPSFRLIDGLLRDSRRESGSFDRYLLANTGLTDVDVAPIPIDFVPDLEPAAASRPPMFLFVIDSLRPDYLAPYNRQVGFTPRIAEFAADSVVFTNAFTRYGGTGLSVPAMWAGSSIAHKQYVQPFHPMNTLEKLLDINGYRKYLSLDSIMQQLLVRSDALEELDRGRATMDYEFCRTLDELESKLRTADRSIPVFAYSLPQDIHMSRLPRSVEAGEEFRSFYAPYATKVHALDACFGRFIDGLKRLGLYDQSVIVVTADHGEMLGEDGRFGHSYHLFPQIVQIPLLVHLPAALAHSTRLDPDALSLTTDITPTMYAALGYHTVRTNDLMGRPLVGVDDRISTERRRGTYVIAASYGAVYAVLRHNGKRLFIAGAIGGDDHAYERDGAGQWHEVGITEGLRALNEFAIRQHVDQIARMYHLSR